MPGIGFRSSEQPKTTEARGLPGLFAPNRPARLWLGALVDLVFPPRCAGCERVDTHWCARCQIELDAAPLPRRVQPLEPLSGIAATGVHEGIIQRAIWSLKYDNARRAAQPLGRRLAAHLEPLAWPIELIAPVPMHHSRLAQRGYNQAQLLAEAAAGYAQLPCAPAALRRWRYTPSQVGLGREARQSNVKDAFSAAPALVEGRVVLLIDDVYTTGATLSACAHALRDAGAAAVYGLTVSAARD